MLRSVDDLWFGEEPLYLGMKVFSEEQLAQHGSVSVDEVRMWISKHRLKTLPTSNGSVRISEAVFEEWAKHLPTQCVTPMTDEPCHNAAAKCLPEFTAQDTCSVVVPACTPAISPATTPTWNDKDMTLMWGDEHLKTFSNSAKMIRKIMQAFQDSQWKTPIAVPKGVTKQQAVDALSHICLDRPDIVAFEYSANKHAKKHPMHWYKLQNS